MSPRATRCSGAQTAFGPPKRLQQKSYRFTLHPTQEFVLVVFLMVVIKHLTESIKERKGFFRLTV